MADLAEVMRGELPSPDSVVFLEQSRKVGRVFNFALYSPNFNLRLRSEELGRAQSYSSNLARDEPDFAATARQKGAVILDDSGATGRHPEYYSRALVTLPEGRGWIEIFFDQTERRQIVAGLARKIGILGFLLFGAIPVVLRRRSKQVAVKRKAEAETLYRLAHTDALTGLANRNTYFATLEKLLCDAERACNYQRIALHIIDLDDFKWVNDTLGHDAGDRMLATTGKFLAGVVGERGIAARIGGDEFAIIQHDCGSDSTIHDLSAQIIAGLHEAVAEVFEQTHFIAKCSIGVAVGVPGEIDLATLAKRADIALYAAKTQGKGAVRQFDAVIQNKFDRDMQLANRLAKACETMAFDLHYQPVFELAGRKLIGFEALLRLPIPGGGFISPLDFIPIAEETGKIGAIGAWVLREACSAAALWGSHLIIAVNLSPVQFRSGKLVGHVRAALAATGLRPQQLELEITEGLLLKDSETVQNQLRALRAMGVRLAIDDFGTGYSSLSYLCKFPVDKIKIDRSFLLSVEEDNNAMSVLQTIVELGRKLNISITAEGVETVEQAQMLAAMRCELVQGYLFGRPTPLEDVAAVLLQNFHSCGDGHNALPAAEISCPPLPSDREELAA